MFDDFTLRAVDGLEIAVYRCLPDRGEPRAVVQICHGASEHARRYERLARVLADAGYGVYATDLRGHGRTAGSLERFGIVAPNNWERLLEDTTLLVRHIASAHPGRPVVLLGHSMGSIVAQCYLARGGAGLRAVILSGTLSSLPPLPSGNSVAAEVNAAVFREGRDAPSLAFAMRFAGFNEPFVDSAPPGGPTGFEWLSRDHAEVKKYVDDPWCGRPLSNGFVADNLKAIPAIWEAGAEEQIPKGIPVLFIAGDRDPVGEFGEGVRRLAERYRKAGIPVTERLYAGARHEMFNETNRDEVHRDLLAWLEQVT
jgi:alpha-beta hydrolase superfamily lysophospholipase